MPLPKRKRDPSAHCQRCGRIAKRVRAVMIYCGNCETVTVSGGGASLTAAIG